MVRDLGSHNGTCVNGKSVTEHVLRDGDRIELGKHRVAYLVTKDGRVRARDPVAAGLVDCESRVGDEAVQEWMVPGSSGESSMFATRVIIGEEGVGLDDSTVVALKSAVEGGRPGAKVGLWGWVAGWWSRR